MYPTAKFSPSMDKSYIYTYTQNIVTQTRLIFSITQAAHIVTQTRIISSITQDAHDNLARLQA